MQTWRFYSYDVWGNAKDGYDVNNVFRTAETVELPVEGLETDEKLFRYLRKVGFLNKPRLQARFFETDNNCDQSETIYMSYKGRPEGELRLEKPE